jgi:hypothetical protein
MRGACTTICASAKGAMSSEKSRPHTQAPWVLISRSQRPRGCPGTAGWPIPATSAVAISFHAALSALVAAVLRPRGLPALDPSRLALGLGPLVRSWDRTAGRVVSDYLHLALTPERNALLASTLGRPLAELRRHRPAAREALEELFRLGVLALGGPFAQQVRLAGSRIRTSG